jgi:hypothetical protein
MTSSRRAATGTLLPSGRVLIAGGMNSDFVAVSSAEFYTPGP